jgi:hypothetical protein
MSMTENDVKTARLVVLHARQDAYELLYTATSFNDTANVALATSQLVSLRVRDDALNNIEGLIAVIALLGG